MKTIDKFADKVKNTIEKYKMLLPGDHVIAGVSGGADSVCLLAVLRLYRGQCPFRITVVHVEHGVRGEASLEDAAFVERICREWEVPCVIRQVDMKGEAKRTGESPEEAGRRLRYRVFEACCRELGANKIAVAHNQNDQAETVLLNLARGSGLRGLGGILPVREALPGPRSKGAGVQVIRPLLFVSRREIEAWLEEQQLAWRMDETNRETEYTRNKIRLEILPKMEREVNQESVKHMAQAARHLQKAEAYLRAEAERKYAGCVKERELGPVGQPAGRAAIISLPRFLAEEELMQEYILRLAVERLLAGRGLKDYIEAHFEAMKRLAGMPCGRRMDFPGGLRGVRRREELWLMLPGEKAAEEKAQIPICGSGDYEFMGCTFRVDFVSRTENLRTFPEKKYTKWLAYDTIKDNVCLRTRRTGDYLIVNRAGGKKKLKDYMIDQKIPREERDHVLLLAEGSHILWVVGWRISEGAKVTEYSDKIIKIQMMEGKA